MLGPSLPQWWTDHIAAAWQRSRDGAIADWQLGHHPVPMDISIVEQALAFGHGARGAYPHCTTWDAVGPHLHADWTKLGHTGPGAWDHVAAIVHHEWLRAGGPGGDA